MSSPAEFSKSLPPLTKAYGTLCLLATTVYQIGLFDTRDIALVHKLVSTCFQVLSAIPIFWSPFFGISLVFMLLYIWSREFPNAQVNIYALVTLKATSILFVAGILYTMGHACFGCYFWFTYYARSAGNHCRTSLLLSDRVASTLAGGNILKTPMWVHKLVARWQIGAQPTSHGQPERTTGVSFRGRAY